MIDDIYNKDVLKLAANIGGIESLLKPDITVSHKSPICGSSIVISLILKDQTISGYSQKIKACALGQASASVMADAIIGKSRLQIQRAYDQVQKMLTTGAPPPQDDWSRLSALAPAINAKPRHGAILMPFIAVLDGLEQLHSTNTK